MARYKIRREGGVFDTNSGQPVIVYPDKSKNGWRQYLAWRKAGNVPDPADAAPPLPVPQAETDFSNLDKTNKALVALAGLLKAYCNALKAGTYTTKTNAQVKADFKAIFDLLP